MSILDRIVEEKRILFSQTPVEAHQLSKSPVATRGRFRSALAKKSTNIIGEVKPKSPSSGKLLEPGRLDTILSAYRLHCVALSVLTDEEDFGGSFELLRYARDYTGLPVMCKDFVVDGRQIELARNAGAEAVLLIAKILTRSELQSLIHIAYENGLEPVVEVSTKTEAEKIRDLSAGIVLINNRNLETMDIDLNNTGRLAKYVSEEQVLISGSGIKDATSLDSLLPHTNNFLVGSSLMRCADPLNLLDKLKTQTTGVER